VTYLPHERTGAEPAELHIDRAFWRQVRLVLPLPGGARLEALLLRDLAWLANREAGVGLWIGLDLPEVGVRGPALVLAIEPCPEIEEGPGRLVTGTFRYSAGRCYELWLEGEPKPLRVTGTHPVWSPERQDWVMVRDLQQLGWLLAADGRIVRVKALSLRDELEPVYNIEVEGDHCYRVGQQGLLVHNTSAPCDPCQAMWGVPTSGGAHYLLETAAGNVSYMVTTRKCNYPKGRPVSGVINEADVVGKTFTHPIVQRMTFRFEKSGSIMGLRGSGTDYKSSAWAKCAAGKGEGDVPGHVINALWGGPGTLPAGFGIFSGAASFLNLIPLDKGTNDRGGTYYAQEDNVKRWAPMYDVLCVRITFDYAQSGSLPARPTKFKWEFMWKDSTGMWGGSSANTSWLDNP
jgi:hypothetical protein